jgi:uncharacterized protein YaaR (DUF327 family)
MEVETYFRMSATISNVPIEFVQKIDEKTLDLTNLVLLNESDIHDLKEFLEILEVKGLI